MKLDTLAGSIKAARRPGQLNWAATTGLPPSWRAAEAASVDITQSPIATCAGVPGFRHRPRQLLATGITLLLPQVRSAAASS